MVNWFQDLLLKIMPDDAFYYLQLANGHTKFTETNGYHPLWALLLSIPGHFFDSWNLVYIDVFIYYTIVLLSPFILWKLYKTKWAFTYWLVPLLWRNAVGMEYALACLLLACAYKIRKPWMTSLMMYTRLDTAILAVLITRGWKNYLIIAISMVPWLVWNLVIFHTLRPDSLIHKTNALGWAINFSESFSRDAGLLSLLLIVFLFWKKRHLALLSYMVILVTLDIARSSTWPWHYVGMPLITFLAFYELCKDWSFEKNLIPVFSGLFAIAFVISFIWPRQLSQYQGSFVHVEGTLGSYNSGILGYFNTQKVYNLDGVFNHNVILTDYIIDYLSYIPKGYKQISTLDKENFGLFQAISSDRLSSEELP